MSEQPAIILDPYPRPIDLLFSEQDKQRLSALGEVIWHEGSRAPDDHVDQHLERCVAIVGQTAMPASRLARAPKLRAILNVEGNFLPNVDYEICHQRHIHVLCCAPAFAPAVAEMALALALAAARGVVEADRDFRHSTERYGRFSNECAFSLHGCMFGLIGCGNIGRQLLPHLRPFGGAVLAHDPWLHPHALERLGVTPVSADELFTRARVVFVLAPTTTENRAAIDRSRLQRLVPGSVIVLVGRSDIVDFDALLDMAAAGHVRAAIDVFPQEPLPRDHRARSTPNTILSAHRAGGLSSTYREIGRMAVDDLELIIRGLPPQRMQPAVPELIERYRSRPIQR